MVEDRRARARRRAASFEALRPPPLDLEGATEPGERLQRVSAWAAAWDVWHKAHGPRLEALLDWFDHNRARLEMLLVAGALIGVGLASLLVQRLVSLLIP